MENKTIKFREHEFKLIPDNILLKKKSNRLLKKYFDLDAEFTGNIDTSAIDAYEEQLRDPRLAKNQLTALLDTDIDKETRAEYEADIKRLNERIAEIETKRNTDPKVIAIEDHRDRCRGLILKDIQEDTDFIKPLFAEILEGDVSKIEYDTEDGEVFIAEVVGFFLAYTNALRQR